MTKTWTAILLCLLLSSCERAKDNAETPPDSRRDGPRDAHADTKDTGPELDTGPAPGAGSPLNPDQRINCELEEGYRAGRPDVGGEETSRIIDYIAVWPGDTPPVGTAWLCREADLGCCDEVIAPPASCTDCVGHVLTAECHQVGWSFSRDDNQFFVICGNQREVQAEPGRFLIFEPFPSYVAIVQSP